MNNEEPIRNSHFPDGHPPNGNGEDTPDQVSNRKCSKLRKKV